MEETEDVIEAGSKLDAEHSALRPMLIVLRVRKHIELQYGETFSGHPENVLVS